MENQLNPGSLPPPPPQPPRPPDHTRSIPGLALRLLGATMVLVLGALLLTRLYFSDDRIRTLLEEQLSSTLRTPVHIGDLKLSLLSSVELKDFKITPPQGLTHPPLTFERFTVSWSLAALLSRKLLIKQILLKNPRLVYEKNAHTDTLTALTAGLPLKAPSPVDPEPGPLQQPRFPIELEISSLELLEGTLSAHTPDLNAKIPNLSLQTKLRGYQDTFSLSALGELGSAKTPAPITVTQALATASVQTHGVLHIQSRGFADTRVSVTLNSQNHTSPTNAPPLPPILLSGQIELQVNLEQGSLHLNTFDWRAGEETALKLKAQAHNLLKEPTVSLEVFEATSNLHELTPWAHLADPTLQIQGQLRVTATPLELSAHSLGSPTTLPINLPFSLTGFSAEKPPFSIHDLTFEGNLTSKDGHFTVDSKAHIQTVGDGVQTLEDITTTLHSTTPSLPWLNPDAPLLNPTLQTRLHTSIAILKSPAGTTRNTRINLEATIPVAQIQSTPHAPPLKARVTVDTDQIRSDGFSATSAHLTLDAAATDLKGTGATATVKARVLRPRLRLPNGQIPLPRITLDLNATREDERLHIQTATVNLRSLAHLQCSAEIRALTSSSPLVTKTSCRTNAIDLKKLLKQIPPPLKPLTALSGSAQFSLALGGRLNPARLIKDLPPPPSAPSPDWEKGLSSQFNHALQWVERLKRGFPFNLSLRGDLNDVSATRGPTLLSNLSGFFSFTLPGRAPSFELELKAEAVEQNEFLVINPKQRLTLSLTQDTLHVLNSLTFTEATAPVLPKSLQNGTALLEGAYQFGGDLRLDTVHFDATGVPVNIDVSAVISDPLQPLLKQAWLDERLPSVNAEFQATGRVNFAPPLSFPALDTEVAGKMSFSTQGTIADGLISLHLLPQFKNLQLRNQASRIKNLSGSFPFQLDLSFNELPHCALIARDLTPGLEKLWLKTSGSDIRLNTASAIFQERLKPYKPNSGITIEKITHEKHELRDFSLQGQLKDGVLHAKEISMHLLGGDIIGEAGIQINHEKALLGSFRFQASNLDASYFKALNLKPGPSSELSTNFNTQFLVGPNERNLEADMNVTKIGSKTLDRFLQLLDPNGLDPALQKYRKYLWLITIDEVAVWVRHENLNMDLLYSTLLRVPGTELGFRPIDREMIRRFSLSELVIDPSIDKHITPYVGPLLGWTTR